MKLYLVSLIFWLPLLYSYSFPDIEVLNLPCQLATYSDSLSSGIARRGESNQIHLTYTIDSHSTDRYSGAAISFDSNARAVDFSHYTHAICTFDSINTDGLNLIFETMTSSDIPQQNRLAAHDIECLPNIEVYRVPLASFKTPLWWYQATNLSPQSAGKISFKNVVALKIENGTFSETNRTHTVTISSIRLHKNRTILVLAPLLMTIVFSLFVFTGRKKTKLIPYEKITLASRSSKDVEQVVTALSTEYKKAGLALHDISILTDVPKEQISKLLKKHFSCTFRQYLNMLRITEAKRLLSESDRSISEIAYAVGYSNTTHFNRIFKEFAKTTPTANKSLQNGVHKES